MLQIADTEILIEQAMDKHPLTMPPEAQVFDAIAAMNQACASYTLILEQQKLVGIFTERDVVRVASSGMPLKGVAVSQVMTQQLITLPLAEARNICSLLALLRSSEIRHLPVVDEQGSVLGVVTPEMLLQALDSVEIYATVELQQSISDKTQELRQGRYDIQATQQELLQLEKMATLGQLIAGVAHEINTPLGAIRASIGNISTALEKTIYKLPQLFQQLAPEQQADFFTLLEAARQNSQPLSFKEERKLKRALKQELEVRNIEDADTIATTLVNMGFTQDTAPFIQLLQSPNHSLILEAVENLSMQQNNIENIVLAVERASKIVLALKSYARQDNSVQMTKALVTEGIDIALTLYQNQLKHGIEVIKNYGKVPAILCYPEALNQVWTNLIHNAIQAMNNKGELEIAVAQQNHYVVVKITDSGCGIPLEIKSKIFEPFFTTKPAGEGSGLGLDIVNKIVEKHRGKIQVESEPGRTMFSVSLPVEQQVAVI